MAGAPLGPDIEKPPQILGENHLEPAGAVPLRAVKQGGALTLAQREDQELLGLPDRLGAKEVDELADSLAGDSLTGDVDVERAVGLLFLLDLHL